ncbi:MAG TPA: hypothetical protein VIL32_00245, partial [Steroidobacteraceae bacterium]
CNAILLSRHSHSLSVIRAAWLPLCPTKKTLAGPRSVSRRPERAQRKIPERGREFFPISVGDYRSDRTVAVA